jgi:hypothetical protein
MHTKALILQLDSAFSGKLQLSQRQVESSEIFTTVLGMDEHTEARRSALRRFVESEGGYSAVEAKYKLSRSRMSYLSSLIAKGSKAPFGEQSAKNWQDIFRITDDRLLNPPLGKRDSAEPPISVEATVRRLGELLRAIPPDEREAIASVISAYARRPMPEVGTALVTLLESKDF